MCNDRLNLRTIGKIAKANLQNKRVVSADGALALTCALQVHLLGFFRWCGFLWEFETDFLVFQFQVRGKRTSSFRDETFEEIGFPRCQQLLRLLPWYVFTENRFAYLKFAWLSVSLRALTDVAILGFENLSAALWTFSKRFFTGEIDFGDRFPGLSFFFCLWVALFEFEADVFLIGDDQECFEWSAFAGNEARKQIGPASAEQFFYLLGVYRLLEDDFACSKVACLIRANRIFADVAHSQLEHAPAALWAFAKRLLS